MRSVTNTATSVGAARRDHGGGARRTLPAKSRRRPGLAESSSSSDGKFFAMNGGGDGSGAERGSRAHPATNAVVTDSRANPVVKRPRLGHRLGEAAGATPISVAENPIGAEPDNHDGTAAAAAAAAAATPATPRLPQHTGLEDLADKYTLGRILGSGTYGQVHRASDKQTGETVALKMINTEPTHRIEYGFPEAVLREIKILRQLRFHVNEPHPNIIMLRNIVLHRQKANTICLVMDYMDIDLRLLLDHRKRELPTAVCKCYLYQLMQAVNFVHANHIIHRDLKPSNVVVNAQHQLKVVDWGLARVFRRDKKIRYENSVCTAWYRSPELILGAERTTHGYGPGIDMWSVGCMFVELLWRERGGRQLRRTLFDPRLTAADGSGQLVLPPGFTTHDKHDPTYLTSPPNLWRVITGKLGVPTPADWPGCNALKMWDEFERVGLTAVGGHAASAAAAAAGGAGAGGGVSGAVIAAGGLDRASKRLAFESELRIAAMPPEAIDLALQLLELDPAKRLPAAAALVHPFFTGPSDAEGNLNMAGAVPRREDLEPLRGLDKAHSDKVRREQKSKARRGGGGKVVDDDWMLGSD